MALRYARQFFFFFLGWADGEVYVIGLKSKSQKPS